jgi:outer membrane usher protein FimD/PapC
VVDRRVGLAAVEQGGIGSAGVSGSVFYDRDGDGRFGAGDAPAPGARVLIAGGQARTDARGNYHAWNGQPYEITAVTIDTLESLDAEWTPATPVVFVRPTPHRFTIVDVPLVRTREVSGRVVAAPGVATSGGVTLVLVNRATGARQPVVTFSDGEYYLSRVRPGEYDLEVDPASLAALGARVSGAVAPVTVPLQGDDAVVLPELRLVPAGG